MDLTKKTKYKGLSKPSWTMLLTAAIIAWFLILLYSLVLAAVLYVIFYTLEYFDEDIYEIIAQKFKISENKFYA